MVMMMNTSLAVTYLCLLTYVVLSSGVILYNKWILSPKYFNFPLPITLTMLHMGFSGFVAFLMVRVFKVVSPVKMTFEIYTTFVIPISAFFASSLWFGNTAYLHISIAFIQMLKALMPVATFMMAIICGTDKPNCTILSNMLLISFGVLISSYGEIHFNTIGTLYQVTGILAESLRLVLTQILLQKKGLTLNPITSLYYIAPCSFVFLLPPWYLLEYSRIGFDDDAAVGEGGVMMMVINNNGEFSFVGVLLLNAVCAFGLNLAIFLVIGRAGAVTTRVAGIVKDWILIALSVVLFPESSITGLNIIGYAVALSGVFIYNYIKVKDVKPPSPLEKLPEDFIKDTGHNDNRDQERDYSSESIGDEEAPLIASPRISHIGLGHSTKQ